MDKQAATQRELEAATYYIWKAIDRIGETLVCLKWMVEEGKDGEHAARALGAFHKNMADLSFIRDKYFKEELRIVFERAIAAIESGGAEDDS